jgi:ubiquinone/menaquinone biosynthesis C-methylase UbiE
VSNVTEENHFSSCLDHVDWINVWKERKLRQLSTPHYCSSPDFWSDAENVRRLYLSHSTGRTGLVMEQIQGMKIHRGARILDIGAGPGTLTVPLARRGCEVTAVEPSLPMIRALEEYQETEKARNIRVINKKWEDVTHSELGDPFDIVIASYSLSMTDIDQAVRKINDICSGTVYLFWFLTPSPSSMVMYHLWPKIHNAPYYYEPMADCLLMALLQMGIYPSFEVMKSSHKHRYLTIGDAVSDFHRRMNCSNAEQDKIIRDYIRTRLVLAGNEYQLRGDSYSARIWWEE